MPHAFSRRRALALTASSLGLAPLRLGAQPAPIRIGAGDDDAYMQPYFADALGLFKRDNLSVEIISLANASAIATAMAGGSLDVGMSDPIALALANQHGLPFAFFAGGPMSSVDAATLVLCVAQNSPIRTAKDLEGKTVAIISLRSLMAITTSEWLKQNGADGSKVKFVELHFPEMAGALVRGTVDAALVGEPFLTGAKGQIRGIGVPFQTVAKLFYIFGWMSRRDWLAAHADEARRLSRIFYEAARWANTHRDESATIEAKITNIPLDVVRVMARNPLATSLDPALVQPVLDIGTRYNLLDHQVKATDLIVNP
jgi:NitT/TauT family transport system substrate-binding protein